MTLIEAQTIFQKAEERGMPIGSPRRMYFDGGPDGGVMTFEVEGSFTSEEFEAMAMLLRAAAL